MVTPALKAHFENNGVALIPLEVGAQMLVDELAVRDGHVEVVLGGAPQRASIAGDNNATTRFEVHVDQASHPYLTDHAVAGVVVVPLVLVLEWFARAAKAVAGSEPTCIEGVRVLRGITVDDFNGKGHNLTVVATTGNDGIALELRDAAQPHVLHYRAIAKFEAQDATPDDDELCLAPFDGPIYDGNRLFHGERFHVIETVHGSGDGGIVAKVVGSDEMAWPGGPWSTDPAAFDGALQLAILWASLQLGGSSLPTAVGAYRHFAKLPNEPLECRLTGTTEGGMKTTSNITFRDSSGRLLARLEGVETHKRP